MEAFNGFGWTITPSAPLGPSMRCSPDRTRSRGTDWTEKISGRPSMVLGLVCTMLQMQSKQDRQLAVSDSS